MMSERRRSTEHELLGSVEDLENKEQKSVEQLELKTPEMIVRENVMRCAERAQEFVSEKKRKQKEGVLQKHVAEIAHDHSVATGDPFERVTSGLNDIAHETVEKKRGLWGTLQDKLIMRRFKMAGVTDPQKALKFFSYFTETKHIGLNVKNVQCIEDIAFVISHTSDPIATYQRLMETFGDSQFQYNIIPDSVLKKTFCDFLSDPQHMQRLDDYISLMKLYNMPIKSFDHGALKDFLVFYTDDAFQHVTDADRSRLAEYVSFTARQEHYVTKERFREDLRLACDDDVMQAIKIVSKCDDQSNKNNAKDLAYGLEILKNAGILHTAMQGKMLMHLDVQELAVRTIKERQKIFEETYEDRNEQIKKMSDQGEIVDQYYALSRLHNERTEESDHLLQEQVMKVVSQSNERDDQFVQFIDEFSIVCGRDLTLDDLNFLRDKYKEHGRENILAFMAVFKELQIMNIGVDTDMDMQDFFDKLDAWKDQADSHVMRNVAGHGKYYWKVLDEKFVQNFDAYRKSVGSDVGTHVYMEDVLQFMYTCENYPNFAKNYATSDGIELISFLREKNRDPLLYGELFGDLSLVKIYRVLDAFITLDEYANMSYLMEKARENIDYNDLGNFVQKHQLMARENYGHKFPIGELPTLLSVQKLSAYTTQESFDKHVDLFFDQTMRTFMEENLEKIPELLVLADDGLLSYAVVRRNVEPFLDIPREKRPTFVTLIEKIEKSPSPEVRRIAVDLVDQLIQSSDPEADYEKIEDIFIKNNLPSVGKTFKVFATLHSPHNMEKNLQNNNQKLSPCLIEASQRKRYAMIYRDLLNIHIKSGNRELRQYLETFSQGVDVFEKMDERGIDELSEKERVNASISLKRLRALYDNARSGFVDHPEDVRLSENMQDDYNELRQMIGAKDGERTIDRVSRMFLVPAGYTSMEEVLTKMNDDKSDAHMRGIETAQRIQNGTFFLSNGDLMKGVNHYSMGSILQSGVVAGEFLGGKASSDATPYDTDTLRVENSAPEKTLAQNIEENYSSGYGNINIIFKDRGQFYDSTKHGVQGYDPLQYELISSGVIGANHYGVRTGLASTEIDAIVTSEDVLSKKNRELFFEIAKNDVYIPVINKKGEIVLSPEKYAQYRRFCNGLTNYDGEALEIIASQVGERHFEDVVEIEKEKRDDRERVNEINEHIHKMIMDVLAKNDVMLKDVHDTSIVGAEIMNTGSTARYTNASHDYDFDLVLRLDKNDMPKVTRIYEDLKKIFDGEDNGSHADAGQGHQLRLKNAKSNVGTDMFDVDVAFVSKSEVTVFGSHDAVSERLRWIKEHVSESAYESTIANIVLTKKVLKEGNAYKKQEHGGIGGIGVENWILSNGGNMMEAFRSFHDASHDANGQRRSFEEFKKDYMIMDPGINVKFNRHDDYVSDVLKQSGYEAMCTVIEKYLTT